jgi:iron complex outermembrane receptor protein
MNKFIRNNFYSFGKLLGFVTASLVLSMPASAQDTESEGEFIFEEVVVTAQRREQNIMDVPVAVSTMSGMQLEQAGIFDMFELQQNVPNLLVGQSQTATTSYFAIRGIGSTSNNFGVESSVGLYVDGVYRSRQSSMINDLVDVEAVDVLRGPQGTLFGKNTASGAVSIRTVRPGHDRNSFVDLTVGDRNLVRVSGAANISFTDKLAFRGTIFATQRDGYVDDIEYGDNAYNDRDRVGLRLQLAGNELSDSFNWRLIADYAEIDEVCCVAITRVDSLYYKGSLANPGTVAPQPGSDGANAVLGATVFATYPYPQVLIDQFGPSAQIRQGSSFDDYTAATSHLPESTNQDAGLSFEFNKGLGDSATLKSISAYRQFETYDDVDIDFTDLDGLNRINDAQQSSFSQEFLFSGEFADGSNWVGGAYYFTQDLDSQTTTTAGSQFNTFASIGEPLLAQAVAGTDLLYALSRPGGPLEAVGSFLNPATLPFPDGTFAFDDVEQRHEGYAFFGQFDIALSDMWTVTLGGRYTNEEKTIDAVYVQTANGPPPDLVAIGTTLGAAQAGDFPTAIAGIVSGALVPISEPNLAWGSYQFPALAPRSNLDEKLKDDRGTGTAKISFFPADSTMLYVSYSTGFKSGGTNTDRIDESFDQIFDAETSTSFELGWKGTYGPVRLALTYYETDFEDFQANSFAGGGFNLQNAGDLEIDGIELELVWRPWDKTEIQANYTQNNGTYVLFENGTAWDTSVVQEGIWQNPPQGDPGCAPLPPLPDPMAIPLPSSCSRSGDPIAYNPVDRAFLALNQGFDLSTNTELFFRIEYTYASEQFTDGDLDPLSKQDDVSLLNARLGLNFDHWNGSLTLWGRNLTDERWYHGSFDVPVAEDKMLSYPSEPAAYGLTFRKGFD